VRLSLNLMQSVMVLITNPAGTYIILFETLKVCVRDDRMNEYRSSGSSCRNLAAVPKGRLFRNVSLRSAVAEHSVKRSLFDSVVEAFLQRRHICEMLSDSEMTHRCLLHLQSIALLGVSKVRNPRKKFNPGLTVRLDYPA
jgi:hypothetical protein